MSAEGIPHSPFNDRQRPHQNRGRFAISFENRSQVYGAVALDPRPDSDPNVVQSFVVVSAHDESAFRAPWAPPPEIRALPYSVTIVDLVRDDSVPPVNGFPATRILTRPLSEKPMVGSAMSVLQQAEALYATMPARGPQDTRYSEAEQGMFAEIEAQYLSTEAAKQPARETNEAQVRRAAEVYLRKHGIRVTEANIKARQKKAALAISQAQDYWEERILGAATDYEGSVSDMDPSTFSNIWKTAERQTLQKVSKLVGKEITDPRLMGVEYHLAHIEDLDGLVERREEMEREESLERVLRVYMAIYRGVVDIDKARSKLAQMLPWLQRNWEDEIELSTKQSIVALGKPPTKLQEKKAKRNAKQFVRDIVTVVKGGEVRNLTCAAEEVVIGMMTDPEGVRTRLQEYMVEHSDLDRQTRSRVESLLGFTHLMIQPSSAEVREDLAQFQDEPNAHDRGEQNQSGAMHIKGPRPDSTPPNPTRRGEVYMAGTDGEIMRQKDEHSDPEEDGRSSNGRE